MLRQYTWDKVRAELRHYQRCQPEKSELYRIVNHGRDRLPLVWEESFEHQYGALRGEVLETFDAYLNCGLLCHGAARVYCDSCKHSFLVAFSCKKRGVCPSCATKRAVKFAEHLYDEVLEKVAHRHVVFSIPKRIRAYMRYDRKLNNILFRAAWGSLAYRWCMAAFLNNFPATVGNFPCQSPSKGMDTTRKGEPCRASEDV